METGIIQDYTGVTRDNYLYSILERLCDSAIWYLGTYHNWATAGKPKGPRFGV